MKFYLAFVFYLRSLDQEALQNIQWLLKSFITNEKLMFFDMYYETLVSLIRHLNRKVSPRQSLDKKSTNENSDAIQQDSLKWYEQFRTMTEYKVNLGFNTKISLEGTTFEYFKVLLNLLQSFPKLENFDNFKTSTYISIASYVDIYIKHVGSSFKMPLIPISGDNFNLTSGFRMSDLLFVTQQSVQLFMNKIEFKYSYLNLICLITCIAVDKNLYFKLVSNIVNSTLQSKTVESDTECLTRFLGPFSQMVFEGFGLTDQDAIISVSLMYSRYLRRIPKLKMLTENTYQFLNLIKFTHLKSNQYSSNILSKSLQIWSEVLLSDQDDTKYSLISLLHMVTFHNVAIQVPPSLMRTELTFSNPSVIGGSSASSVLRQDKPDTLVVTKPDSKPGSFSVKIL